MFAPGVPQVMAEFKENSVLLATFVVSVYILGFAFGPLIVAPISEYSGRTVVYNTCNLLFLVFNIASAVAPSMASLVVFRFLDGVAGVTPTIIGSGTIADIIPVASRGRAMALWSLGPLFGPIIGPLIGGYLLEATTWRWVFWVLSIAVGPHWKQIYFLKSTDRFLRNRLVSRLFFFSFSSLRPTAQLFWHIKQHDSVRRLGI